MKYTWLKKIGIRLLVINGVYFMVKLTIHRENTEAFVDSGAVFYYLTTFLLFTLTWEVNDWLIRRQKNI